MNGTERNGTDNEGKEGGVSSRGPKRFPPEPPFQNNRSDNARNCVKSLQFYFIKLSYWTGEMVSPSPCKSPPPSRQAERLLTLRKTRLSFLRKSLSSLKIRISTLDFTYFPKRKTRLFTFLFGKEKILYYKPLLWDLTQFNSVRFGIHIFRVRICVSLRSTPLNFISLSTFIPVREVEQREDSPRLYEGDK